MSTSDPEFDSYDDSYQTIVQDAINFSGMSHDYATQIKAELIVDTAIKRFGSLEGRSILDVGCGIGLTDVYLQDQAWHITGADVSPRSVEQARLRNPNVNYVVGSEGRLPFDDESFDLCFTICVMHHVPPENWTTFLREMRRVLKPGGLALVLEHNPFNPLTRLVVSRIPFDANAVLLSERMLRKQMINAQLKPVSCRYFLFTPWARMKRLERGISRLPLGAQYMLTAER
jgi:ubiquinone/menaquinone biosynthesis C-methylase UbiE